MSSSGQMGDRSSSRMLDLQSNRGNPGPTGSNRLFIGNLDPKVQKEELENLLSQYGSIRSAWVARDPPGFAFVEMSSLEECEKALAVQGVELGGQAIRVEIARPGSEKRGPPPGASSRGRGGRGRGGFGGPPGRYDEPYGGGGPSPGGYDPYYAAPYAPPSSYGGREGYGPPPPRGRGRGGYGPPPSRGDPYGDSYNNGYGGGYPERSAAPYNDYPPEGGYDSYGPPSNDYGPPSRHGPGPASPPPSRYDRAAPYPPPPDRRGPPPSSRYGPPPPSDYGAPPAPYGGRGPPRGAAPYSADEPPKCFNCNAYGHRANQCPKPKNTGECYTCGEHGHKEADCPQAGQRSAAGGYGQQAGGRGRSRSPVRGRRDDYDGGRARDYQRGGGYADSADPQDQYAAAPAGGSNGYDYQQAEYR